MLLYGDPSFDQSPPDTLAHLRSRPTHALQSPHPSLDTLRTLLIHAGQFEQAAFDSPALHTDPPLLSLIAQTTDHAAAAFLASWTSANSTDHLRAMSATLASIPHLPAAPFTLKIPEGFAFYTLYPEQYITAALRWLTDHADVSPRRAVVIGIRSIGTTLSAVVAQTLTARGWQVHRLTLRPTGHPFSRQATIHPADLHDATHALIVDEGPGLSGSSMAAVAQALTAAGLPPNHLSFLPSHPNPPGPAAPDHVRHWWSTTPRYVVPLSDLRWNNRSLPDTLAALSLASPPPSPLSWGEGVYNNQIALLPACGFANPLSPMRRVAVSPILPISPSPFDRTKYLCTLPNHPPILWKFVGLHLLPQSSATDAALAHLTSRAQRGWTLPPLGSALGFIAMPWIPGTPLAPADATPTTLTHVARYLLDSAGPPLSPAALESSFSRLRHMLHHNTREALGDLADLTHPHADAAARALNQLSLPRSTDARPAPHEWLRTPTGQLLKPNCLPHDHDHTLIGPQPLLWDLAGTLVEWHLNDLTARPLLQPLHNANLPIPPPALLFYRLAYTAFRLAQCTLSAGMNHPDPAERSRLHQAIAFYRDDLRTHLTTS